MSSSSQQRKNAMTKDSIPSPSQSPSQTSTPLTAAKFTTHQATAPTDTPSGIGWVSNGEVALRHAPPNQDTWNDLIDKDPIAAEIEDAQREIEDALRAASKAKKDQGN
jgi:hypothetical protein